MQKKVVANILKTFFPLCLGFVLIYIFFSSMTKNDFQLFEHTFKHANYFWIICSLILGVIAYLARAARWRLVLEPMGYTTPFWNRYHAIMIGYLVNLTVPRAGEASRSVMLFRSDAVPFSNSFGTILAERIIDLLVLMLITFATLFMGYDDFIAIKKVISFQSGVPKNQGASNYFLLLAGVVMIFVLIVVFVILRQKPELKEKVLQFLKKMIEGVLSIFKLNHPFKYIGLTVLIWFCYIAMFALPFYALSQTASIPLSGVLIGFLAGTIGIIFTNGGIGSYPLLVGMVISFYLQSDFPEQAHGIGKALGLLVWSSQTVLMIILGLLSLWLLPKKHKYETN